MKLYQHILIISGLSLFTILFYRHGYGAISFLLASVYLGFLFIKEVKSESKNNEVE